MGLLISGIRAIAHLSSLHQARSGCVAADDDANPQGERALDLRGLHGAEPSPVDYLLMA